MLNIKEIRKQTINHLKAEKLSINFFAKQIGVFQSTLHRFIKDGANPTVDTLNKIESSLSKQRENG